MAIAKLPEEVRSAVRNGITIASTAQCVAELVYNSLDADADSIIIHLDVPQYKLQVFDNGTGITFENLKNCGIRYNTSKCRSLCDLQSNLKFYGYRGEALASIVASSGTIIIQTRPKSDGHTYCKTFSNGKPHHPTSSITSRTCPGTTITVQNFMYNAPVRRQRIKPDIDVEEIKLQVEGLALAHPHVSFTILDESDNSTVLNVTRSQSTLETFSKLYGEEIAGSLHPAGPLDSGKHRLYGFISKSSHHNKKLQFIFVNGKLVKRTKVHKLINMIMRKSDVLRGNGPWQELPLPERVRDFLWVSPTKKRDRFCVFLINIDCPLMEYDMTLDPDKTLIEFRDWDSLFEYTEALVKDFLRKHDLAYVTSDPKTGESEEESPTSNLEDVEELDEGESVRNKLERFKHDSAKQGEAKTFTARTIRSNPAKRFLSSQKKTNASKKSKSPPKNEKQVVNKVRKESTHSKIQTVPAESPTKNRFRPTDSQTLVDKISHEAVIDSQDFAKRGSPNDDTSANVNSSLNKFRKLFQQINPVPLKTPADQMINIEDPPPIVKRKYPLEHRIKALMEAEKIITSHSEIAVTNNAADREKTEIEISQKICTNKDSNSTEKTSGIDRSTKYFSNDKIGEHSGYFKKICPTASIATQTVSNCDSVEPAKDTNFKTNSMFSKPNLKNISMRMKQCNESRLTYSTSTLQSDNRKEKRMDDILNTHQKFNFLTFSQLSNGNIFTETSKELPALEMNCNLLSSKDLICALGDKGKSSNGDTITKFENNVTTESRSQNQAVAIDKADNINQLDSDTSKQGEGFGLSYDVSNQEKINNSSQPAVKLSHQCARNDTDISFLDLNSFINDDTEQEALNHNHDTLKEKHKRLMESELDLESLPEKVLQCDSCELAIASDHNEADQMESGYTSDIVEVVSPVTSDNPYNSEVIQQNCLKAGQKRSSKTDGEMKCIIKKAHLEINLDSNQCCSMDVDELNQTEGVEPEPHIVPNDHDVQEFAASLKDIRFSKEKEIPEDEIPVTRDLLPKNMQDVENDDCSVSKNNKHDAEISVIVGSNLAKGNSFEMFARNPFLPKGLSPVQAIDSAKSVTLGKNNAHGHKLPISESLYSLDSGRKIARDDGSLPKESTSSPNSENDTNKTGFIASYLSEMENKKYIMECKVMSAYESIQNKSIMKIFNLIYPCTFTKSVIAKFRMLGRLDNKFIVAKINMEESSGSGSLVLFDQHAVHERIRLEKLMKEYVIQNQEDGKISSSYIKYKSVPINPSLELATTASEIRLMEKFTENFERLGLSFERCPGNEDKNEEVPIKITSIPACLSSKDAKELGPLGLKERIRALIREQTENLVATRGLGTFSPEVLRDAINMEACRGAVKFGDTLSEHQCRWLLRNLAKCNSPFQCAHGRPSLYPIAAISHLEKHWSVIEQEKPCLKKINEFTKQ